ncbi:MAG TPA: DUF4351 domain-containing protein [Pirellulales bacterium]|nr:DUF4351 domain-containing protein [Pirellulales bacterium]
MKTSPIFDEIRAEGRQEGREEGRAEGGRALVFRLGRQKFGKPPTKKQQKSLEAVTELARLEDLAERLLYVDSWSDLLADVKRRGRQPQERPDGRSDRARIV